MVRVILENGAGHFRKSFDDFSCPPNEAGKAHFSLRRKS
jgi:hypothetical protein